MPTMSSLSRSLNSAPPSSVSSPPKTRCGSCFLCAAMAAPVFTPEDNARSGELAHPVAHERHDRLVPCGTGGNQRPMRHKRAVEAEREAGEVGQHAAGFVHQKVGGGKVPVVA